MKAWGLAFLVLAYAPPIPAAPQQVGGVELMELTVAQTHTAILARTLTARQLVEAYLARIDAYDKQGPTINSLIMLNPRCLERADELDAYLVRTGRLMGPLHGIPFIVTSIAFRLPPRPRPQDPSAMVPIALLKAT